MTRFIIIVLAVFTMSCASERRASDRQWAFLEQWDADGNLFLTESEFVNGYVEAKFFTNWSSNGRPVSSGEFCSTLFHRLDKSNDQRIDSAELGSRRAMYVPAFDIVNINTLDLDGDNTVSIGEFTSDGCQSIEIACDWQKDGMISAWEMAHVVFTHVDYTNDLEVSALEFYKWQANR